MLGAVQEAPARLCAECIKPGRGPGPTPSDVTAGNSQRDFR
jgi:hypothetical protein